MSGTHLRLGGHRIDLRAGGSLQDFADLLAAMTRGNIRAFRDDPSLRAEMVRRVMSPPCASRCYVSRDGTQNDCNCNSGLQWTTDPEAEALQGCPARDVWNDARALWQNHQMSGRGPDQPIVADCDCLTPLSLGVAAHMAWHGRHISGMSGIVLGSAGFEFGDVGALISPRQRFAVGITLPPEVPGKERIGHAYGLVNYRPAAPQPEIKMPYPGDWWVWDASAHWGMARPADSFYTTGEYVGSEVRRDDLDGLR